MGTMAITLQNKQLRITLETAGETYRGTRFDWNGTLVSARVKSSEILGYERPWPFRNKRTSGRGLHNEFGLETPVGYDDCPVGGWFPKIGTGWLKKKNTLPYKFHEQYEHEPLAFQWEKPDSRSVRFSTASGERNGYAYTYTKTLGLTDQGFEIRYELENTGSKPILTNEYVHNFLCINQRAFRKFGEAQMPENQNMVSTRTEYLYSLQFSWELDPTLFRELNDPQGIFAFRGNQVDITQGTKNQYYAGGITNGTDTTPKDSRKRIEPKTSWKFFKREQGISLKETLWAEASDGAIWGWSHVLSPELFFPVNLETGQSLSWKRSYTLRSKSYNI